MSELFKERRCPRHKRTRKAAASGVEAEAKCPEKASEDDCRRAAQSRGTMRTAQPLTGGSGRGLL